ncbi:MAG TPA: hypothetical protein VNV44_06730 [Solirubrobacteraceae bacterium]|nr:hypothetical protein [Solirubrobacteraceae bacterium]
MLIDVRRTGKSTVALGAMEQLARAGCMVFLLDAREGSPDSAELARRLRHQLCAYRTAKGKLFSGASRAVNTLYEIGLGVTTLIDDPATRAAVAGAMQALNREQHSGVQELDAVLREISAEAESQDSSAVVLIDEVQAITALPDRGAIEALFRDRLAARSAPSFVFAGSERTAMETLFAEGGMLHFHGIAHSLKEIAETDWREGLSRAFRALGCEITEDAITELLQESGGAPHRTMLIARETHRIVQMSRTPKSVSRGHVVAGVQAAQRQRNSWRIGGEE